MSLVAIKYERGRLEVLDQLQLPLKSVYKCVDTVQDGWDVIRQMKVRGAPAIAIVGALSVAVELHRRDFPTSSAVSDFVAASFGHLRSSRPTAVNLFNAADHFTERASSLAQAYPQDPAKVKKTLAEEMEAMMAKDVADNKAIGQHGATAIAMHVSSGLARVLTHCNTGSLATSGYGTALGVIRALHEHRHLERAYCTETRPYNQGSRLTAYELVTDDIPATLIADSMVSALMQSRSISAVVVGADRIAANGDTANKIGTYQLAIAAAYHEVPFYVAAPSTSVDLALESGAGIPIEERPADELCSIQGIRIAAPGIQCWNPAFDVTPARLITGGIVTEHGVFEPSQLAEKLTSIQPVAN
eukprot:m.91760 g.91760  ORF g.91760 m.91760 type:complete len:359 (+) comp36709_c0_seq6:3216-4292(+)